MTTATPAAAHERRNGLPRVGLAMSSGVGFGVAAAAVLAPFAFLGVVNGDEGWYTVSSRLAAAGQLPYRDFAFTQGPVYLYLLAPFERLLPGLITARVVSAVCAAAGIALVLMVARRIGGTRAVVFSALALLAATPSLPYWLALTKTYGVASLFLAATLYALTSSARPAWRLPVATVCAAGFALARPSAVAFALAVSVVAVWTAPTVRVRLAIVGAGAVAVAPFLVLFALAPSAAYWGLVSYHNLIGVPSDNPWQKFFGRTFDVMRAWPGPTLLVALAAVVLATSVRTRQHLRGHPDMVAVVAGLGAFLVLHELGAWFWAEEYVVPILPSVIVLAVSTLVVFADELMPAARRGGQPIRSRRPPRRSAIESGAVTPLHVSVALVVCVGVTAVTGGHSGYIGAPGWNGAPSATRAIAKCVDQHSRGGDQVLALSVADVVTAAHRKPVERASLGVFSYQDVSTARANELHIFNAPTLVDMLTEARPKVVVLSGFDVPPLNLAGYFSSRQIDSRPFDSAISNGYDIVCRASITRQIPNVKTDVVVLARKQ